MAADEKWYFTKEQLANSPSRKCGIDADKELSNRQQAANFIQDMGQRLAVTQLCINTAIVYMHRFYVFHSLTQFHRNSIAAAALFLAAKVEEQPRKLESIIKVAHMCLQRTAESVAPDTKSEQYLEQAQDLVFNENVLLQTLGFDVAIDHPHTHVVRCCHLVKASRDLSQTSYFMASNSLHLTTMCLQYKPTVVACFCIHLACKWSNWEIPQSAEGRQWFWYVDKSVTTELLQQLTAEFLHIFDKCPSRLKKKIKSASEKQSESMPDPSTANSPFNNEPRKINSPAVDGMPFQSHKIFPSDSKDAVKKPPSSSQMSHARPQRPEHRDWHEKRERERLEREKIAAAGAAASSGLSQDMQKHHGHYHKMGSSSSSVNSSSTISSQQGKHPVPSSQKASLHHNHHHRPDQKLQQQQQQQQQALQRHSSSSSSSSSSTSSSSQSRQRLPPGAGYPHAHGPQPIQAGHSKDSSSTSTTEAVAGSSDTSHSSHQDSNQISGHLNDTQSSITASSSSNRLANNNHNQHNNRAPPQHDKRGYDPRHKLPEHRKDDVKNYNKFNDPSRQDRQQRKFDTTIEQQRSEEVRKLIEKPIPHVKPRELPKEEYIASMLKQSHHQSSKYPDKIASSHNSNRPFPPHEFNKLPTVSKPPQPQLQQQQQQQQTPNLQQQSSHQLLQSQQQQQQHYHSGTRILKDIKNGNASSGSSNNVDDRKLAEKRARPEEPPTTAASTQPKKQKSLFSPEKESPNRSDNLYSQRNKLNRQKTPPPTTIVPVKAIKRERIPDLPVISGNLSFDNSPNSLEQTSQQMSGPHIAKRQKTSSSSSSSFADVNQQQMKIKTDDITGFDSMKMLGRVPDLIPPIRDNLGPTNGRTQSVVNDLKPPELIKPFEPDSTEPRHLMTNGLDTLNMKQESHYDQHMMFDNSMMKKEYLSPMKSAQSISALLHEPLAPMPSLLDSLDSGTFTLSQSLSRSESSNSGSHKNNNFNKLTDVHHQMPQTSQSSFEFLQQQQQQQKMNKDELSFGSVSSVASSLPPSTVDISSLLTPAPEYNETTTAATSVAITNNVTSVGTASTTTLSQESSSTKHKSDHHKSEKKKKKEKHKHKDKSKEKHKHKHKEKHRDSSSVTPIVGQQSTPPIGIRITIPKDKLNLSSESSSNTSDTSGLDKNLQSHGSGIKIKIPKEKLKSTEQAPLKLKIRTGGTSGISEISDSRKRDNATVDANKKQIHSGIYQNYGGQQQQQQQQQQQPLQNQQLQQQLQQQQQIHNQQQQQQQQQRPTERQNGRHYSSSNKVRGGGRGGLPGRKFNNRASTQNIYNQNINDYYKNIEQQQQQQQRLQLQQSIYDRNTMLSMNLNHTIGNQDIYMQNYPPGMFNTGGYYCDPSLYYQQYHQQYSMFAPSNVIMTSDGAIDTSIPPPSIPTNLLNNQNQQQPPLPSGPPPTSTPPPPPPPPPTSE